MISTHTDTDCVHLDLVINSLVLRSYKERKKRKSYVSTDTMDKVVFKDVFYIFT